jgi:hypothetical protein
LRQCCSKPVRPGQLVVHQLDHDQNKSRVCAWHLLRTRIS